MATQRYSVTPHPIETLLTWVKSGEIAIPEIQRPFVWDATKVRNLLDSLYQGYPVGYLIAWRNPTVKLKDGTPSAGKRILIDGQQRVTALMAALLGRDVLTRDYETVRIRIAFHPEEGRFEVANSAIRKDSAWIDDVVAIFSPDAKLLQITKGYTQANPGMDEDQVFAALERLRKIINNHVGVIDLAEDLDIETVTEIFIRVNSAGAALSQADFAMSKIAVNEAYGGNLLRKAIDYFCHLAVAPDFLSRIEKNDKAFAASEFFPHMRWLKDVNDDLYDPTYTDMLRVAFTSEFRRGKLQDLVALLSGRNFETKQYEDAIAEEAFGKLKKGILAFMNKTHFDRITMILRSAGFVTRDLIRGQNALNFAYILYLRGRAEHVPAADLERLVRRWYAMSILRGRYTGSPETAFDLDVRQIEARGMAAYADSVVKTECARQFLDGDASAVDGHVVLQQPLFSGVSGRASETRRPGVPLPRYHRARPADEPQRCPSRLPAQPPEEPGSGTGPLQPDCEFRPRPERDQHRHRRPGTGGLLQGTRRTVCRWQEKVRRNHRCRRDAREPTDELFAGISPGRPDPGLRRFSGGAPQTHGFEDQVLV